MKRPAEGRELPARIPGGDELITLQEKIAKAAAAAIPVLREGLMLLRAAVELFLLVRPL